MLPITVNWMELGLAARAQFSNAFCPLKWATPPRITMRSGSPSASGGTVTGQVAGRDGFVRGHDEVPAYVEPYEAI